MKSILSTLLLADARKWAEDTPRGEHGRWTAGGGSGSKPKAGKVPKFASVAEAEKYAKSKLGMKDVNLGKDKAIAQIVMQGIQNTRDAGGKLPKNVEVQTGKDADHGMGREWTLITAINKDGSSKLFVNGDHPFIWERGALAQDARENAHDHWMSSTNPNHMFNHEAGHLAHAETLGPGKWYTMARTGKVGNLENKWSSRSEREMVAREVSKYGSSEPMEMVAEVYAGRLAGKSFSSPVMSLYQKFGGKRI